MKTPTSLTHPARMAGGALRPDCCRCVHCLSGRLCNDRRGDHQPAICSPAHVHHPSDCETSNASQSGKCQLHFNCIDSQFRLLMNICDKISHSSFKRFFSGPAGIPAGIHETTTFCLGIDYHPSKIIAFQKLVISWNTTRSCLIFHESNSISECTRIGKNGNCSSVPISAARHPLGQKLESFAETKFSLISTISSYIPLP